VDLSGQGLQELGQLLNDEMFPSLRELSLEGNPFSDMKNVGPLSKLMVLRLNRTRIDLEKGVVGETDDIGGLGTMPHLQVLEIASCGISDISHFARIPLGMLRILHLQGNEIIKIDGLSHLEQLRELVLDRNKIRQFDELSFDGLKSLRELRLDENAIKTLDNLGPLPRLHALHLAANRISELTEVEKLRNLRQVVTLHLSQNPVTRKPLYRATVINAVKHIRAVDGREVTDEEREKVDQLLNPTDPAAQFGQGVYVFTDGQGVSQDQPYIAMTNPMSIGSISQPRAAMSTATAAGDGGGAVRAQRSLPGRAQSVPRRDSAFAGGRQ